MTRLGIHLQLEDSCPASILKDLCRYFLNISSNLFFPSGTHIRLILEVLIPYVSLFPCATFLMISSELPSISRILSLLCLSYCLPTGCFFNPRLYLRFSLVLFNFLLLFYGSLFYLLEHFKLRILKGL